MVQQKIAYLIGRFSGQPNGNFDMFDGAKRTLEGEGYVVYSPRHHDAAQAQVDADLREGRTLRQAQESDEYKAGIRANLPLIYEATVAFVLQSAPDFVEHGKGGPFEILTMQMIGTPVFYYDEDPTKRRPYNIQFGVATKL